MNIFISFVRNTLIKCVSHKDFSSFQGAFFAFSIRVASAVITLITQIFLARWLGSHYFGIYSYLSVCIIVVGTFCTLGFSVSVIKFIPQYQQREEWPFVWGFISTGQWVCLLTGSGIATLGILTHHFYPEIFGTDYKNVIIIAFLSIPAFALTDFQDGVGRSQGWLGISFFPIFILRPLLVLVTIFSFEYFFGGTDAKKALICQVFSIWFVCFLQGYIEKRKLSFLPRYSQKSFHFLKWFSFSVPLVASDFITLLKLNLDVLLLQFFASPSQVGIYFAGSRLASLLLFVQFSVNTVVMTQFSNLYAQKEIRGMHQLFKKSRWWMLIPSLIGAFTVVIMGKFLLHFFGDSFGQAYTALLILAFAIVIKAGSGGAQALFTVADQQVFSAILLLTACVFGLVSGCYLIPKWNLLGAALTSFVMYTFEFLLFNFFVIRFFKKQLKAITYDL